jgi:hypothetical protein
MTLESTTMRPEGLRYIRNTKTALMNAKSRAIANKAASLPSGTGDNSKSRTGDTASRSQRMAEKRKQAEEKMRSEDAKKKTVATKKIDTAKKPVKTLGADEHAAETIRRATAGNK